MYQSKENDHAIDTSQSSFKDPSSEKKLLNLVAMRTHWAANCFRGAAISLVLGAIFFDGLNPWAQALNLVAVIAFLYAAIYVDEAAALILQVVDREEQLKKVSSVVSYKTIVKHHETKKKERNELNEAWSKLKGVDRTSGLSLAEAVESVVNERDRAWKALDEALNTDAKAVVAKPAPVLRIVSR